MKQKKSAHLPTAEIKPRAHRYPAKRESPRVQHEPLDLIAKRAKVFNFDVRRARVLQALLHRTVPNMDFAYGFAIHLGLNAFEQRRGAALLAGEPYPESEWDEAMK